MSSMSEEGRLISDMLRDEAEGLCMCVCWGGSSPLTWGGHTHVSCSPDGPSLL